MEKICIIGVDGQDGSYLAEQLIKKKFLVLGIGRRSESIYGLDKRFFEYKSIDLCKTFELRKELENSGADAIIYCASTHGPNGFDYFKAADDVFLVNSYAPHVCLNYCRETNGKCSLIFLSSIKVFDYSLHRKVNKNPWDCRKASDLYSRSKMITEDSIKFYRNIYGVNASVVWLSNHESIKRIDMGYFLPDFASQCYRVIDSGKGKINIRTLDFYCDWGCASQFMEIIVKHMEKKVAHDLFIGTGQFVYARDLAREFLGSQGYDLETIVSEATGNKKNATARNYLFNKEWLPNEKTQNNLLGPKGVLKKIYTECSKYLKY
ncbi:NAD-dependent epimerase/dehydratase family protein [Paracoccaceae bacterium]|nr:NAD-dependent epimerase/dehydratase family protein [Paracoccaceae bacterium]